MFGGLAIGGGLLLCTCHGGGSGAAGGVEPPAASCTPTPASSRVVNVKEAPYGAKSDGTTDDTAALQKAIDAVGGTGGTVSVPAGTYRVDALTSLLLRSGMTLSLDSGAILAAIPNGADNYTILRVSGVSNVNILGGTLLGERSAHTGTTGEQGMGLRITGGAQHIAVVGVTARECWGDGFMVADASDVTLCHVTADHNRRQGLSITGGNGVIVRDSRFANTGGTLPEDGLDIEPNSGQTVNNVLITGCVFTNNAGDGIEVGVPIAYSGLAFIYNVVIESNTMSGNGASSLSSGPRSGLEVSNTGGHVVKNSTVQGNAGFGIYLRNGVTGTTVTRNTVTQNRLNGILEYLSSGNTITENALSGNGVPP
ncbi:right-handed parallel beta-helix repeat-containing protein [Geothrix terrae]|uniref:right-handed parallel beta-helix repeat-containing protein n=1 Tax=Geothrix terrae TaxID=2922720 RepID=UPI001FAC86C0|nr:right-handed parallel beta-helix repeat-containing protein [Geothrix terrae]